MDDGIRGIWPAIETMAISDSVSAVEDIEMEVACE